MTVRELVTVLGFKLNDEPIRRYEKKIEGAKKKASSLAKATSGVASAVKLIGGAVAAAGIAALGKSILETTGQVEQYRVTLGTMMGDQEKANRIIHDLDYSPVSDFYGTAAAIGGLQGMVTFGMQAEEASDTLTRLGDIAQGNGAAFQSLSLNMGQVFAKGKADATDLKQFVQQGFDVVGEVAAATGRSRAEVEKAGVTYEQCALALRRVTDAGGKYEGMLAKQSRTLPGLVKQFQSLSAAIQESIGTAVLGGVKDLMQHFLNVGKATKDNIAAVGTRVFDAVVRGVARVVIFMEVLQMRMRKFGGAFAPIKAFVKDVFGFFGRVLESLTPLLMGVMQALLLAFKPIGAFVRPALDALARALGGAAKEGADFAEGLLPLVDALTPAFSALGRAVGAVVAAVGKAVAAVMGAADAMRPLVVAVMAGVAAAHIFAAAQKAWIAVTKGQIIVTKAAAVAQKIFNVVCAANPIGLIIIAVAALIGLIVLLVKNWDKVSAALVKGAKAVGGFFKKAGTTIKNGFVAGFNAMKTAALKALDGIKAAGRNMAAFLSPLLSPIVEEIKSIWSGITGFFKGLWDALKSSPADALEYIKDAFFGLFDRIKGAWSGITGFFKGLWDALKSSPEEAIEYIRSAFFGLFDKIFGKFTGFIDAIRDGWAKVQGFFGGAWEAAKGFFGWEPPAEGAAPARVNDMILTPRGAFSTHPDDYIFAMKDPTRLLDGLARPAYAGMAGRAASYDYSRRAYSSSFSAPITVNVSAGGMSAAEARAAVEGGVRAALRSAIAGSRGAIPSPEARRA